MTFPHWMPLLRRTSAVAAAVLFAAGVAQAQSNTSNDTSRSASYSSSQSGAMQFAELALPEAPAPRPSAAGAGQYGNAAGSGDSGLLHHLAFEASGGVNAPAGDKSYITWGGQFTIGGGLNFSRRLALLAEYQFLDDKLPGHIIAEAGAQGGHVHLWSLTLDPVVSLFPKSDNDVYLTGGYGFYRKVTSFTDIQPTEYCYFYCGIAYASEVVGHFSSNQGGFNIGGGYQHRMGSMYGDSKMKLFAEVRYVEAMSPAVVAYPNGLAETTVAADTKVIPISLGVRW